MSVRLFISRDISVTTNMIIAHDFEKNRMHPILPYTIASCIEETFIPLRLIKNEEKKNFTEIKYRLYQYIFIQTYIFRRIMQPTIISKILEETRIEELELEKSILVFWHIINFTNNLTFLTDFPYIEFNLSK